MHRCSVDNLYVCLYAFLSLCVRLFYAYSRRKRATIACLGRQASSWVLDDKEVGIRWAGGNATAARDSCVAESGRRNALSSSTSPSGYDDGYDRIALCLFVCHWDRLSNKFSRALPFAGMGICLA